MKFRPKPLQLYRPGLNTLSSPVLFPFPCFFSNLPNGNIVSQVLTAETESSPQDRPLLTQLDSMYPFVIPSLDGDVPLVLHDILEKYCGDG